MNLVYSDQTLSELDNLKFLGLHIDNHFMWKFQTYYFVSSELPALLLENYPMY